MTPLENARQQLRIAEQVVATAGSDEYSRAKQAAIRDAWATEVSRLEADGTKELQRNALMLVGYEIGRGRFIEAIRAYRAATGAPLKVAKDECERIRSDLVLAVGSA